MISYTEVLPSLVRSCSSYPASFEAGLVDPDDGDFINVGHFVRHLIRRLDEGDTGDLAIVFGVIEQVLAHGDSEACSLISQGFLDDMANLDFYSGMMCRPVDFAPWLGSLARAVASSP